MSPEELKQFEELAAKFTPDNELPSPGDPNTKKKERDIVREIVHGKLHPVFQEINDGGRRAANEEAKTRYATLEQQYNNEKKTREALDAQLRELNGKAPEAAKLQEKYENDLKTTRAEYETKLTAAQRAEFDARVDHSVDLVVLDLIELGVKRPYARTVMAKDEALRSRIAIMPNGKPGVLKAGEKDVFLVPPDGKSVWRLLAEELAPKVENDWKDAKTKSGSGTTGSQGSTQEGNRWQQLREAEKAKSAERSEKKQPKSLSERLGRR